MTRRLEVVLAASIIAALLTCGVLVAWPYALTRTIHIDEFNNLYAARLLDLYRDANASETVELYLLAVAALTRDLTSTFAMLMTLREFFFWLLTAGLCVIPLGVPGLRPMSRAALLTMGVLCAPLWRHGIEVRHDALLGIGFAALYVLTERARAGGFTLIGSCAAGAIAVFMQLNAHKGFALSVPALGLLLLVARQRGALSRTAALVVAGGAAMLVAVFTLYAAEGHLTRYLHALLQFSDYTRAADRFSGAPSLWYFARAAPVQTALALAAVIAAIPRVRRRQLDAVTLGAAFFLVSMATFFANPNPYPYNLSWLGFGVLAGAAQGLAVLETRGGSVATTLTIVLLCALTGTLAWRRDAFFSVKLDGQRALIEAAELLTAPNQPVLDLGGLVATRPPASRDWLVHSLLMRDYLAGRRENVDTIADTTAPPVLLRSYRWNWIPPAQVAELEKTYTPVTEQLWVLGCRTTGVSTCLLRRAGRYLLRGAAELDGVTRSDAAIVELAAGAHALNGDAQLAWLGPTATTLPEVARVEPLFQGNDL